MQDAHATRSSRPRNAGRLSRIPWLAVVLCAGLALGAGAGYRYARQPGAAAVVLPSEQASARQEAVQQREAELRYLRSQLDTADGELSVERAARTELEAQLRAAQAESGRLRDQLAFYEQLLPPGPEGSVDLRAVEVQHAGAGLRYKILLMRSGRSEQPFSGALRFEAAGVLKGETVSVELAPLQVRPEGEGSAAAVDPAAPAPLPLQFEQYQRSEGMLALPEGFVPEAVTVSVLEGATVRAARTVPVEF
ncbi:DUF6776 family protein [Bordetella sp. 2513F-2]